MLMLLVAFIAAQSNARLVHYDIARNVMVALTVGISYASYSMSVQACSETYSGQLHRLLSTYRWYYEEARYTAYIFVVIAATVSSASGACYAFGYTVFWPGILGALAVVCMASILSGVFGTLRGIEKYAQ
ncbi:MAG: hypothetical protein WC544_05235 [Patescibacteria group bacterium]